MFMKSQRIFQSKAIFSRFASYSITKLPIEKYESSMPLTYKLCNGRTKFPHEVQVYEKQRLDKPGSEEEGKQRPSDSWLRFVLPFSSEARLRSSYQLFDTDQIRLGRVFEDMDSLAADIAYRHAGGEQAFEKATIVTLALDRCDFISRMSINEDLQIEGNVSWCGKTSMEILLSLKSGEGASATNLGNAVFLMVARDKKTYGPYEVPPLLVESEEEKVQQIRGEQRRERRKRMQENSLDRTAPTPEENKEIHTLWLERKKNEKFFRGGPVVPLSATKFQNTQIMQGQERNIHHKMFGGMLMREAFQLAWANARILTGGMPKISFIDDVRFLLPVEIGSVVLFNTSIPFTNPWTSTVFSVVEVQVVDPNTGAHHLSNQFFFGFTVSDGKPVPFVMPESYEESMQYLDARRRALGLHYQ